MNWLLIQARKKKPSYKLLRLVKIGLNNDIQIHEFQRGVVFNLLNLCGLLIAITRLAYIVVAYESYNWVFILVNCLPFLSCLFMFYCMYQRRYVTTVYFSFVIMPFLFFLMAFLIKDRGMFCYLIPYFIYPFFFLNAKVKILVAFIVNALLFSAAVTFYYSYPDEGLGMVHADSLLEFISFSGALILTFVSLYAIKFQLWIFQSKLKKQRDQLQNNKEMMYEQNIKLHLANSLKDKLFSVISHDLRTPLRSIELILDTARRNEDSRAFCMQNLPAMLGEVRKTNEMFDSLIKWARLQISQDAIVNAKLNIVELAEKVANDLDRPASQKGITINKKITHTYINADKDIVEIVLRNIVSNSIKFSNPNTEITISGVNREDHFVIGVKDSGIGISGETLEKIKRNAFFTTPGTQQEMGTGFGLYICRDLIQKSKGEFFIESEPGCGTTVSFSLPQKIYSL